MSLLNKLFGTNSTREIKKITPLVNAVEGLADKYADMTDAELSAVTPALKERLAAGETLDDILPDAFAAVREAADRVLGKRPFRVQIMGGIILHQGRIAEMKTGEGKTLVATMPAYLNALTGRGVHVVTVNEYLARCGAEEMGRVYDFLGLSTGLIIHDQTKEQKIAAYSADITYGTNNEFGFDYLRDNMVLYKKAITQRGHVFAIVDEVDSILIDEARTPLIISGEGDTATDMYDKTDKLVAKMRCFRIKEIDEKQQTDAVEVDPDADYIVDEKARSAVLTAKGIEKVERYFAIENYADPENSTIAHHVNQALKAHGVFKLDVDYVLKDGQVMIVDTFTGRIMPGRRWSDGLHQAIEAKEHVKIEKENKTLATITFQNYFRMYEKLSGMTGTAMTEEEEFREIYNLDVVEIPTNMPMIRRDHTDVVYKNIKGKYDAILRQIIECHEKGQPVLVGTVSVEKSEELSKKLSKNGIKHTVLNAKYHDREAEIVAQAGKLGTVTIATNMAGRGTDILLGGNPEFLAKQEMRKMEYEEDVIGLAMGSNQSVSEEVMAARKVYRELYDKYKRQIEPEAKKVREAGGLFIIGTERHESRRIDNQLRGRSGRQGDPGESRFYLSLEDDLMRLFGSERIAGLVDRLGLGDDDPIDAKILSNSIESAQKRLEDTNFNRRRNVLAYDDVMNQQRNLIYAQRREVLDGMDMHDKIVEMLNVTLAEAVQNCCSDENHAEWALDELRNTFFGFLCTPDDFKYSEEELEKITADEILEMLTDRAMKIYADKEEMFGAEQLREIERVILLRNVDRHWMNHIDEMDELRGSIGLNAYAQRNPLNEYRIAGGDMFEDMSHSIRIDTVRAILSVVKREPVQRQQVARVTGEGRPGAQVRPGMPLRPGMPVRPGAPGAAAPGAAPRAPMQKPVKKVGPNDPCPCGSGKKYKKCHGIAGSDEQ
ncbi:MAG: preprotein translocase subunit SecA [Clostridia bacterium]|nr:preprotein translocase subunit SecA [Clostridia bacterium]